MSVEPAATESYTSHAVAELKDSMMGGGRRKRGKSRKTKRRKIRGGAVKPENGNTNTMVGGKSRRKRGKKGRKGKKSRSYRK